MRIKKKNTRGNAKNFITRTQAVKRLQVSLADFRRLCIFKGIYPREPRNKKKANKGSTAPTTFYYFKDIKYLMHEPVLEKFREHKTFAKKLTKALGRGQVSAAKKLEESRKPYQLDHLIKERYPSFPDALRDIDDALNMLFLFANLPATNKISSMLTRQAQTICNEWLAYVARERLVRKVFVSIKGVYYQADVRGEEVRWLVPYKFPENIPSDVDFRIMLTFLEFYSTFLHFVIYKLYTDSGLVYPPKLDIEKSRIISGLASYILETHEEQNSLDAAAPNLTTSASSARTIDAATLTSAQKVDDEKTNEDHEQADNDEVETTDLDNFEDKSKNKGDILEQPTNFGSPVATLFSGFVFYAGREVPIDIIEFLILACGGSVISESALDQLDSKSDIDLSKVTHQIVDRPVLNNKVPGRTYVQPQWIFDSINKCDLVPANLYLPGEPLPPHLSPWGDRFGYNPEEAIENDGESESESESEETADADGEAQAVAIDEDESEDEDLKTQKELELESKGVTFTGSKENEKESTKSKNKKRKATREEDEEKDLKMIMMSNKQRKLYKKMQYSNSRKEEKIDALKKKKKQIVKTKEKLKKLEKKD